jgi:hypothetical protein
MRTLLIATAVWLVMTGVAAAQEADPRSKAAPWPVDQRCAVMSAHIYNQGALTGVCVPREMAPLFASPGLSPVQISTFAHSSASAQTFPGSRQIRTGGGSGNDRRL